MTDSDLVAGRYRLGGVLGHGSFTDVYRAEDTVLGRKVAIKVLAEDLCGDPRVVARFEQEARMSTGLIHDHIGRVYDVGSGIFPSGGGKTQPFLVMERVTGLPLTKLVERGPIKPAEAERLISEILAALDYAHRAGVVHRDLKPANVLVSTTGGIKVTDFGIAAALSEASDLNFLGDPHYTAPEGQAGARVDARSDLYSVGVLFFQTLTGKLPFENGYAGSRAVAASSLNARVPVALNVVVARALEPVPASRYQSAGDFLDDIRKAETGVTPVTSREPDVQEAIFGVSSVPAPLAPALPPQGAPSPNAPAVLFPADGSPAASIGAQAMVDADGLPPTVATAVAVESNTHTDQLVSLFGKDAVTSDSEFSSSLPTSSRQRRRVALGLTVSMVFVVVMSMVTLWVLNIKPVDFFPSSARTVPNVVGYNYSDAFDAINKSGLTPVRVDQADPKIPKGSVIRTDPDANKKVDIGTRVTLFVSSGAALVAVPNLSGMTVEAATAELKNAGFIVGTTSETTSATIPQGMVKASSPEAGKQAQKGTTVNLVLSNGLITIPDLTGLKIEEATSILGTEAIMLTPILQGDRSCKANPEGVSVTGQSVPPGDVPAGTPITLTYCAG